MPLTIMSQNWCESSRSDIHCPERIGIRPEMHIGIAQRAIQPIIASSWDTCTNVVLHCNFVHAPSPETVSAGPVTLSIDDRVDRITAALLTDELAQYTREHGRYRQVIRGLVHRTNPALLADVPDTEMKKRIRQVLVLETMRDLFADLSDDEIDSAREAARSGDFFR